MCRYRKYKIKEKTRMKREKKRREEEVKMEKYIGLSSREREKGEKRGEMDSRDLKADGGVVPMMVGARRIR